MPTASTVLTALAFFVSAPQPAPAPNSATPQNPAPTPVPGARRVFDLNGAWDARHDPSGRGVLQGLPSGADDGGWTKIPVPSVLDEHQLFAGKDGIFWLRRVIEIENELPRDRRLRVRFERVVESCQVWWNGTELGEHVGGDTPFGLDVTGAVTKGKNILVVRLDDRLSGLPAGRPAIGGIPGNVVLEDLSSWAVGDVEIDVEDGKEPGVRVSTLIENASGADAELQVSVTIAPAAGGPAVASNERAVTVRRAGEELVNRRLAIANPVRWDLQNPHLYAATVAIARNGETVDSKTVKFGFRTVGIAGTRVLLNGEPIPIKAVEDAGYETITFLRPGGLLTPERKVRALKEGGFNAIVIPGRLAPRGLIEKASEFGLLVIARPALRGVEPVWLPVRAAGIYFACPFPNLRSPGKVAQQNLLQQICRDRNDPSVIWWGIPDGPRELVKEAWYVDSDAVVSRDAVSWGSNKAYPPGGPSGERHGVNYLRAPVEFGIPIRQSDIERIFDLGDRGELAFAELRCSVAAADCDRFIAGLEGETWRPDAGMLVSRAETMRTSFAADGLNEFFPSMGEMVENVKALRGVMLARGIEAARANRQLAGYVVSSVADAPWAVGEGMIDFFGRPTPSLMAAKNANMPRRMASFPIRRGCEVRPKGSPSFDFVRVLFAPLLDDGAPVEFWQVQIQRPDGLSGYQSPSVLRERTWLRYADVPFGAGEGVYTVHPLWKGFQVENAPIEMAALVGIDVPLHPLTAETPTFARPKPSVAVVGDVGDLWEDEERFLQVIDALETARAGGTTLLLFALSPDSPLIQLGAIPGIRCVPCDAAFCAQIEKPAFVGAAVQGIFGDPINDLKPSHTMVGIPSGAKRWSVAIGSDGACLGANLARIPFGKGSLVLTTLPLAETAGADGPTRRILSNLVEEASRDAPPPGAIPERAKDRDSWRARLREAKKNR